MKFLCAWLLLACSIISGPAISQSIQKDFTDEVISQIFGMNNGKILCLGADSSHAEIRKRVDVYLAFKASGKSTSNDIARAAYSIFPCPFSPYRDELQLADATQIEGVWVYPEASQKLRFGPKSPMWAQQASMPIKCEGIAYYQGGETRVTRIVGKMPCPFSNAKDMDASRQNPKVSSWEVPQNGKVVVSRTDISDHVEEWEIFRVVQSFEVHGVSFETGDLVAYLRREKGNDFNAATTFRHLKKLN